MTNANLQKVLQEAKVKMAEIEQKKLEIEFKQKQWEMEQKFKQSKIKNAKVDEYQNKILEAKRDIYKTKSEKNKLKAEKATGDDGIKMAEKGLKKLKKDLEEAVNGGDDEYHLATIKTSNEWSFNFLKSRKIINETYDSKITRVKKGKFEIEDGGVGCTFITVGLKGHFLSDQVNNCLLYTKRKYLNSYKTNINKLNNTIMNKEELVESLKARKRKIDAEIEAKDNDIDGIEDHIEFLKETLEDLKNNLS